MGYGLGLRVNSARRLEQRSRASGDMNQASLCIVARKQLPRRRQTLLGAGLKEVGPRSDSDLLLDRSLHVVR